MSDLILSILIWLLFYLNNQVSSEILYPSKVTSDGRFISYDLHHKFDYHKTRTSRSISDDYQLHYSLDMSTFGKVIIALTPNHQLLSPGFVIERWSRKSNHNDKLVPTESVSEIMETNSHLIKRNSKFCFFKGHILNYKNHSIVSVSTCSGLKGVIHLFGEELLIQPHQRQVNSSSPHAHVLIKRSIKSTFKTQKLGTCGISDKINYQSSIKKRELWELKHKKQFKNRNLRHKRSVSVERNVETLVVADQKTINYYTNEDLELYILTIMNVVNTLFHDASIGNAINIIIVRVILIENQTHDQLTFNHSSKMTLRNFCRWQKHVNPKDENHPNHHDTAILITRENICNKDDESCNTLGLAEIAGMCQPQRSCAIAEDTGLTIAYTIAHELGHNFGMSHDSLQNGCLLPFGKKQHIMSPNIKSEASPVVWSNCSRVEITKFLDRDWGRCLDDEPSDHDFMYPEIPPGSMYDADHQCRFQFGQNASYCSEMSETLCETLWCKVDNQCITKLRPAAEGTICDKDKWCFLGKCVEIGKRPDAIDGEWGPWSPWSQCTRTCGAGIMYSERECNNPMPQYGGRYCIGDRKRYKVCNTEECPPDTPSFRAKQCSSFNNKKFKNEYFKWQPVLSLTNPCQLECKPEKKSFSMMLSDAVIDGTPCHPGTRDMCINGKCKSVSCDWGIDSDAQEDRCGICHGDGTQCLTIRGNFSQETGFGYAEILMVPEGARNIRIEEIYEDENYLALIDRNGDYILNGDWIIDWTGEYPVDGTTFYYDRNENGLEKLHAPGPTKEEIKVMILFQTKNRGVKWEYTIANTNTSRKPEFSWQYDQFDLCSRTCGGGTQTAKVRCFEKEAGIVEDKFCFSSIPKPIDKIKACNKHICPPRWWSGPWHHCNATCSESGIKRRSVLCVRSLGPDEQIALLENECDAAVKPVEFDQCKSKHSCNIDIKKDKTICSNDKQYSNHL